MAGGFRVRGNCREERFGLRRLAMGFFFRGKKVAVIWRRHYCGRGSALHDKTIAMDVT